MTPAQWDQIKQDVAEKMKAHVRPFITPLGTETPSTVRLVGTGNYVGQEEQRVLLTCQHVAYTQPIHYRFFGDDSVFEHPGPWRMDPHPIDAAVADLSDQAWNAVRHQAATVPLSRFASKHQLVEPAELVFLYGFAGENADYGFGIYQTNGSGYCSQEIKDSGDDQIFEVFWEPDKTRYTDTTSAEAREAVKFDNPEGLSGSLVWNTRYLEVTGEGRQWAPEEAVVTGLLRRYDPNTDSLLVWRVEHLLSWLCTPQIKVILKLQRYSLWMTDADTASLPDQFDKAAALAPPRRTVTIEIDADLLAYIEAEGNDLAAEVNGLLRFVMDTTKAKEAEFAPDAWEPGEMAELAPAP